DMAYLSGCSLLGAAILKIPLSWQKECTEGPEKWCQDLSTAIKCGTLDHCHEEMGLYTPVVSHLHCQRRGSSPERIEKFLEKGCQYLPFQDWSLQCKKMVDTGVVILIELVCGAFRLCSHARSLQGSLKFQKPLKANEMPAVVDFPETLTPFIANVPLLLYPQDEPQPETLNHQKPCADCTQVVAEMQETIKSSPYLVQAFATYARQHCEHLEPKEVDEVSNFTTSFKWQQTFDCTGVDKCPVMTFMMFTGFPPKGF
uniref:Saposin A-type domain-containing protein n=1 Tax=Salvator merianae TaxID=96440 RepID=A0A8D0BPP1_SALMN